jgi:hypothetical protein
MKRYEFNKLLAGSSLALRLAAAVWLPVQTRAADQVKGGQKLTELNQINTKEEAEALKPGDAIAMVCAKCKSVAITLAQFRNPEGPFKQEPLTVRLPKTVKARPNSVQVKVE